MIDIIIPIYNTDKKVLLQCLSSIYMQTIIDKITIILVDDGSSNKEYQEILPFFNMQYNNITLLEYKQNKGPAYARQFGLEHSSSPYIMFVDSDDALASPVAAQILLDIMETEGQKSVVVSGFYEVITNDYFIPHQTDLTWLFGKLYNRQFINLYNIKFYTKYRSNEDTGFNTCFRLCSSQEWPIVNTDVITYYWLNNNSNSITRKDNSSFLYGNSENDCFYGYCKNIEYAVEFAIQHNVNIDVIEFCAHHCLCAVYLHYIRGLAYAPDLAAEKIEMAKDFFNNIFKHFNYTINFRYLTEEFNLLKEKCYEEKELWKTALTFSLSDFISQIKRV